MIVNSNNDLEVEIIMEKTCCFTGHRPEKITENVDVIKANLKKEIIKTIELGYNTFLTGMAPGTDTWAADIVLEMKKENADIKLICAIPFRGVERNRSPELQAKFHEILKSADGAEYMTEKYKRWVFLARDRWVVDHSSYVIAVYNGSKGGTEFTVDYARKKGKRIVFVNLETEDDIGR